MGLRSSMRAREAARTRTRGGGRLSDYLNSEPHLRTHILDCIGLNHHHSTVFRTRKYVHTVENLGVTSCKLDIQMPFVGPVMTTHAMAAKNPQYPWSGIARVAQPHLY